MGDAVEDSGCLAALEIRLDGVLNPFIVAVEVVKLIAYLIQAAQIGGYALALRHQVSLVAFDHRS
jgi:hypothetical protein